MLIKEINNGEEIEKIDDLEELKKLQKQISSTREKIKKYSLYNMNDIGEAIAKVMTAYEGIKYIFVRNYYTINEEHFYTYELNSKYSYNDRHSSIHIIPNRKESEEYGRYRITYYKELNDKNICYLPPSYYTPHKKAYYIKDFLNYLYLKKVENNVINDKDFYLKIADEFIEQTKDEQIKRQTMIKKEYQKKLEPEFKLPLGIEYEWPLNL